MTADQSSAVPSGTCLIHGPHGLLSCPKCSTSAIPLVAPVYTGIAAPAASSCLRVCRKCGSDNILTRWHPDSNSCRHDKNYHDRHYEVTSIEHLHLRCRCCQYVWMEPTKDTSDDR